MMLAVTLAAFAPLHEPSTSASLPGFEAAHGLEVQLFAESPMLFNPTAMDVDEEGRVWVTEGVNYRQWNGRNPGLHHGEGDRVVVLQDTDGDGVADSSTVFVQDKDLTAPLGIAVIDGAVYVSCSPNLFVYRDLDGDLKADEREVLLTGFGGFNHDHGLHSVVEHPSGDLLWCAGNAGPHLVEDRDGFHLRSGSMYNGGGPAH
ncbi:MAG: dehydrogenase, partial [Planctomycetes bacterium]|nr:dehydrogenase [Planctomycetota bacterium]